MALKVLELREAIDQKKQELSALREKEGSFSLRENELAVQIEQATEAEHADVEGMVDELNAEKEETKEKINTLSREIEEMEAELAAEEERQSRSKEKENVKVEKVDIIHLPKQVRAFDAFSMEQRKAIVEQDEVKQFLTRFREAGREQRALTGGELTIPVVFLDIIAENMYRYSKLLNRVRVRNVAGEARQTLAGLAPEAVWTEACGALNELNYSLGQVVMDGYKVAGFIPICNSLLEDSDVALSSLIIEMLSESLGYAKDKAILYGKGAGSHMPLGIVTRLAQQSQPSDYPANGPAWQDLHTTNIIKIDPTDMTSEQFWQAVMGAAANTANRYSRGELFWTMNSKTYYMLRSRLIAYNYEGYPVFNQPETMPFIGGNIDILEFIPDGDVIGGYGDLYLWVQRSGMQIELSREVQFIQDNTVFRGKERADGAPVIPAAFVAFNINNVDVTTVMTFAADKANDAQLQALSIGSESLTPTFESDVYSYTITAASASDKIEATAVQAGAKVSINYNGTNVRNGGTVTWKADGNAYPLTVTVTMGNKTRVYTINVTKAAA